MCSPLMNRVRQKPNSIWFDLIGFMVRWLNWYKELEKKIRPDREGKTDYLYRAEGSQPSSWRRVTFINTRQTEGGLNSVSDLFSLDCYTAKRLSVSMLLFLKERKMLHWQKVEINIDFWLRSLFRSLFNSNMVGLASNVMKDGKITD